MKERGVLLLEKPTETSQDPQKCVVENMQELQTPTQPQMSQSLQTTTQEQTFSENIIKPNYDFIEELTEEEQQKVYKIGRQKQESKSASKLATRLKMAVFSLVISVCTIWGIVNLVDIASLNNQIAGVSEIYELNLASYLSKLATLDTASNYNELFPTYPNEPSSPSQIAASNNWFNRICDFISGLFGG